MEKTVKEAAALNSLISIISWPLQVNCGDLIDRHGKNIPVLISQMENRDLLRDALFQEIILLLNEKHYNP
ncbi:MAG: hypothetical protein ABIV51_12495 [Saprospiraceae bacterium]